MTSEFDPNAIAAASPSSIEAIPVQSVRRLNNQSLSLDVNNGNVRDGGVAAAYVSWSDSSPDDTDTSRWGTMFDLMWFHNNRPMESMTHTILKTHQVGKINI